MTVGKPDIATRAVAHFPGFEPFDSHAHHARYRHAAGSSAKAFGIAAEVSDLCIDGKMPSFIVRTNGDGWKTEASLDLFGHSSLISDLGSSSRLVQLWEGYVAAWSLIRDGTLFRYMISSWRYALFFLFPFVALSLFGLLALAIAVLPLLSDLPPVHFLWSLPAAIFLLLIVLLPAAKRLHLSNLFDQWRLAVRLARMDQPELEELVGAQASALRSVLTSKADDHLVTGHSLGGVFAILALSRLIKEEPGIFSGKVVTFVTLAGSGLQVSLIASAKAVRDATRRVLECPGIYWLDYQCLADPVHQYGSKVTRDIAQIDPAFAAIESPPVVTIRVKDMLLRSHYRRIRWNILRVHRQFVLGSDLPYRYDFLSLTAGPYASASFAAYNLSSGLASSASETGASPIAGHRSVKIAAQ